MKPFNIIVATIIILIFMFSGCSSQVPQPSSPQPEASEQPDSEEKQANWVFEINDTQQITDEEGLIWNYTLSVYASKSGGTDALGSYTGDIVLDMAPDMNSAKALAEGEGAELLAMLFKHHSQANDISFDIVAYSSETRSELMASAAPDNPLLQVGGPLTSVDALAVFPVTFEATQEPISMTVSDGQSTGSGTIPGGQTTVTVPVEISIKGADAYFYIYNTVHPLSRAFTGIITGDVGD